MESLWDLLCKICFFDCKSANFMVSAVIPVLVDEITTFQSVVDGGRDEGEELGGSIDYEIHLDFDKLGLWPGAFMRIFAETQFGDFINSRTGTGVAANIDGFFPNGNNDTTNLTGVVLYQFLSEWFGLYLGKIDTLGGDTNEFAAARGKDQFMHQNFVFNPVTLRTTPYSALGGGFLIVLPDERGVFTFAILDPNGQPNEAGFNAAFDDGAMFSGELRIGVNPFGLKGHQLIGGTYSTKDFALLDQDFRLLLSELSDDLPNLFGILDDSQGGEFFTTSK